MAGLKPFAGRGADAARATAAAWPAVGQEEAAWSVDSGPQGSYTIVTMSDLDPLQRQPGELDPWTGGDRAPMWPRIAAALSVIALIVVIDVVFVSPGIRRRAEYALLRVQAAWKQRQPRDLYLPTPVLPAETVALPTVVSTAMPTRSTQADAQAAAATPTALSTPARPPPAAPTLTPLPSSILLASP